MSRWPFVTIVAVALLGPVGALEAGQAGETGGLAVTVRDAGGVIPGASVLLTDAQETTSTRRVTDARGLATFPSLSAGTYDLRVEFPGFADSHQPGIVVEAGQTRDVEIVLTLAQFSLEVMVTTANRREQLLLSLAEPTNLIDRAQIEDTGARTAKDVLLEQTGAGVSVHPGGGQGHVSINGIPNSGVLVLVDGRRFLGRDGIGNFNLEDLELSGVDRIEVVKGAGSALYGSEALGGVINFITKKHTEPGVTNELSLTGGSYTDVRVSDTVGYRKGPAGFSLAAGHRTYDGFDLDKTNPQTIGQPHSKFYTVALNGDVRAGSRMRGRFFGDYTRRNIDKYFFSGATQLASTVYDSQRELTRSTWSPELDVLPTASTTITVGFTAGKYSRDETQVYATREVLAVPWREWNREFKATGRQLFEAFGQSHSLQLGYEFRRETMDRANLRVPDTGQRKSAREINVAWLQQEVSITSALKVTAGFRHDDYSDFGSEWSPKFSVVYAIGEHHRLRASQGHGFRAPTFGELYLDQRPFFIGNPTLNPEVADAFTGGYSYVDVRLQASADYFRTRVKDGVTFNLSRLPYTYMNFTRYTAAGVNTTVSASLPRGFVPSVSYAYLRRDDDRGQALPGAQTHAALVKLLWTNPRLGLRANVRGQVLSEVTYEDGTSKPAYQIWSVQVSKKLVPGRAYGVGFFAQVDNLFDRTDVFRRSTRGEPIPGDYLVWIAPRTFLTGITFDLDLR